MLYTYHFRLYPNNSQQKFLKQQMGSVRFVYNKILEIAISEYEKNNKKWNYYEYKKLLPKLKKQYPFLKEINSQSLQGAVINLNKAFKAFFKGISKFPKFKRKRKRNGSFAVPQHFRIQDNKIFVPKLKTGIKARFHREIEGKIKSLTISGTPTNKYYVSILVEKDIKKLQLSQSICGIDVGIKSFATIAQGDSNIKLSKIDNPNYLSKSEKRLKRLQKQLDRKQHRRTKEDNTKASKNYIKFSKIVSNLHEKIKNQRKNFLHKLSKSVINDNQVITVENLNVKGMLKNHHLAKAISDTGWSMFINMLKYKAEWYGRTFIQVDRFYPSSKTCSNCGYIKKDLKLSDRQWICPVCGTHHDRDINASVNLYKIGQELSEYTPVERGSVDDPTVMPYAKKHPLAEAGSSLFQ